MADNSSVVTNDYDRFFAMSLDLLCIAGFDGHFKEVNPSWERTLGWTREELTGRPFIEFVHPDDQQATIAEAQRLSGGAVTISFENRYRCRDGSYRWLVWTANGSREDQLIFAVARDVTEHKDVAQRLERMTAEYRALLDSAAEAMWGIDREGKTLFVNRATTELLGWETDELIGRVMHDVVHHTRPDGSPYPAAECPVAAVALNGESVHVDTEVLWRKDGTSFPAEYRATPFIIDGDVVGAVVTTTDISDRMQAAEARRAIEAERRLATSYRRLELLRDIDKGILAAGSLEELASTTLDRLRRMIAVDQSRLVLLDLERAQGQVLAGSTETGETGLGFVVEFKDTPFEGSLDALRKGERVIVDLDRDAFSDHLVQQRARGIRTISIVPLRVEGELVAMVSFSRSGGALNEEEFQIAEEVGNQVAIALRVWRLRGEEALRLELTRANEQLRAADEMKNLFLAAASHDVRGRIAAILGYAELVARADDRIDAERASRFVGEILRSARALDGLLSDLLNLDRLFRGALEPHRSVEDVATLIQRVVDEQGITSRRRVELHLEDITQQVDRVMVERSVDNLVRNAERYTPPDSPIWVHTRKMIPGGTEIIVEDAGPGVPEHDRLRIFEPFRRGSDASQRPGGSGIGLYLVSRFAELQGGQAWVQAREGGGASFHMTLPASASDLRSSE